MAETIVVGVDGSDTAEQAVAEAVRLAKALDAELHVVTAFKGVRGARIAADTPGGVKPLPVLPDDVARTIEAKAASALKRSGLRGETHLVEKDPADALLEVAERVGANLIVVGSQGMSGAKRLLGSVPNKVSHEARCNVLIVATQKTARA